MHLRKKSNNWRDIVIETLIQEVLRSPSRTNYLKIHTEVHHDKKPKNKDKEEMAKATGK